MDESVDPLPLLIAELDQAMKMAPMIAQMAKAQYDAYREQGFTDKQALYLAATGQKEPPGE